MYQTYPHLYIHNKIIITIIINCWIRSLGRISCAITRAKIESAFCRDSNRTRSKLSRIPTRRKLSKFTPTRRAHFTSCRQTSRCCAHFACTYFNWKGKGGLVRTIYTHTFFVLASNTANHVTRVSLYLRCFWAFHAGNRGGVRKTCWLRKCWYFIVRFYHKCVYNGVSVLVSRSPCRPASSLLCCRRKRAVPNCVQSMKSNFWTSPRRAFCALMAFAFYVLEFLCSSS